MLAGFAEIEFTPAEGYMPGQFVPFYAKGTRTPLMAHAMAVTNRESSTIMISLDLCGINNERVAKIKEQLSSETGVPRANIMICATHTHTGCFTDHGETAALEALGISVTDEERAIVIRAVNEATK